RPITVRAAASFTGFVDPTATRRTVASTAASVGNVMFGSDVNAANLLEPVPESRRCLLATVKNVGYALRPPMTATPALLTPLAAFAPALTHERAFLFVGERLWLDFVNSDAARAMDALRDFDTLMSWLEAASLVDGERALGMRR